MKFFTKNKKTIRTLAIIVGVGFFTPALASAGWFIDWDEATMDISGFVFGLTAKIAGMAGWLLDISLEYSVKKPDLYVSHIVNHGWEVCRNICNLFFIFILIFIGIATIIQLQSYHYRRLLLGIIIAALLVNFSLLATRIVVDASNLMAMQFLCAMTGGTCDASKISATIANGFQFQTLFGEGLMCIERNETGQCTEYETDDDEAMQKAISSAIGTTIDKDTWKWKMAEAYALGIVLMLIVTFVLAAGALLFIIRAITLMILMIFAPFAFIAMVLKNGQGKQWWGKLLNQAFFAPIYLFLIYLVVNYFSGGLQKLGTALAGNQPVSFLAFIFKPSSTGSIILFQFVIAGTLLMGALIVAKSLGFAAAGSAIGLASRWRKAATGYAGRITRQSTTGMAARATTGMAARAGRRAAGGAAESFATGTAPEGAGRIKRGAAKAGQWTRNLPIVGGSLGTATTRQATKIVEANRKKINDIGGGMKSFDDSTLQEIHANSTGFRRVAAMNLLTERGKLKPIKPDSKFNAETIEAGIKTAEIYGMPTKKTKELAYQWAQSNTAKEAWVKDHFKEADKNVVSKMDKSYFKLPNINDNMNAEKMRAIFERGDAAADVYVNNLKTLGATINDVANSFASKGNIALADWLKSTKATPILKAYGLEEGGAQK